MAFSNDFFDYLQAGHSTFNYVWNGELRTASLATQAILPTLGEVMRMSYAQQCRYFRWLVQVNPTLNQVHSRWLGLIQARKLVLTGSERNVKAISEDIYDSFDDGDGWRVFSRRVISDVITCGRGVVKVIWERGRVVSAESLDAAYVSNNNGLDSKYPPERYPLAYSAITPPYYLERGAAGSEYFVVSQSSASRREAMREQHGGIVPPLIGQYAEIEADHNERVIEYAQATGKSVWQLVFTPSGFVGSTRDANAVADAKRDNAPAVPGSLLVEVFEDASKVKAVEILRATPPGEILARRKARLLALCNAPYQINPILIDPSFSGTNSLSDGTKSQEVGDLHSGDGPTVLFNDLAELQMRHIAPRRRVQVSYDYENPRRDQARAAAFMTAAKDGAAAVGGPVVSVMEFRKAMNYFGIAPAGIIPEQGEIISVASDEDADVVTGEDGDQVSDLATQNAATGGGLSDDEVLVAIAKAEGRVTLFTISSGNADPKAATKALTLLGESLVDALQAAVPVASGEMRDSIDYEVLNPNTKGVTLEVYAGSEDRPEVAVRSTNYGRRGFGPKKAKALKFTGKNGKTVLVARVKGAKAQNWTDRAWADSENDRKAIERKYGAFVIEQQIKQTDVALSNAPHIDKV
jgi:hypothetical protein